MRLQEAIGAYDRGEITKSQLVAEQDAAAKDSVQRMEATGTAIVSDGEQRASSFATYSITGGPFRYKTFAADLFAKSKPYATKPMKQAVIAPSMLYLLYPLKEALPDYSREQFLDGLCDESEKDIRKAFAAGAKRVSIDFTEGRLANKRDSRNPWTNQDLLQTFIDLNNRVIDRFSPEERRDIGIHTCPGWGPGLGAQR